MPVAPSLPRLFMLDLRRGRRGTLPVPAGFEVAVPAGHCAANGALAVLVAVDGPEALADWQERFHPCCPHGFPHILLLDPYAPDLARRGILGGAADCCPADDGERLDLALLRLQREASPTSAASQPDSYVLRLQAALDTLPTPIFVKDRDCRYIACNRAFEDYLGLPRQRIVGSTVFDVAPPDLAKVYEEADRKLLTDGGTQIYEAKVRYADNSHHDVIFHKAVFRDPLGEADGIAGAMLDISERKALEQRLEVLAATDFLTGVYNLRTFYELAGRELSRLERGGGPLSVIVMDIDRFKEINDQLGHAAGDEALRSVVAAVRENLREQDVFARAGGDEFRILLPDTTLEGALHVGERIGRAVGRLSVASPRGKADLSLSTGVATHRASDETLDFTIARADEALYRAKSGGRNQVVGIA